MKEDKLKELMQAHQADIEKLVQSVYKEGFDAGLGITLPTQSEFDEAHKTPNGYGEEDEWLVLSSNLFSEEQAQRAFKKHMIETGWYTIADKEEIKNILDTIRLRWIGYKTGPYENEPSYWLGSEGDPTYWQAWVVETQ